MSTVAWGFPTPKPVMVDDAGGSMLQYKVYSALVTQDEPNDPIVTVLENTLGVSPVWHYGGTGVFYVESIGAFKTDKTVVIAGPVNISSSTAAYRKSKIVLEDQVWFMCVKYGGGTSTAAFDNTLVEIRVYP